VFQFTELNAENEGDYRGFNGYFDTAFTSRTLLPFQFRAMCDCSGEGPLPPPVFLFVNITDQLTNMNWQ
jgi:hypothetical protein